MLCKYCPLKRTCSQICSYLEPHLPSMEQGRVDYEDLLRLYQGRLMTQAVLDNIEVLTSRQLEVVNLYYRNVLSQKGIADQLGISQQAVADSLQRARNAVSSKLRSSTRFT
ncbi:MAG: sigma factor-like helix-turn-helix DNA-binding protein [Planctomycetota bacterium]